MTADSETTSNWMDKDTWEAMANRIAKELWSVDHRAQHPGISPNDLEAAWAGDVVRERRKLTKVALRKMEKKGILFIEKKS